MDSRHERRHHFRGKPRPGRVLPIRFRTAAAEPWIVAETRNIGVGGAFVATAAARPIGSKMDLEVVLPTTERRFELSGIVRWVSTTGDDIGMGLQFVDVDVDILLELNDYFSSLTGSAST